MCTRKSVKTKMCSVIHVVSVERQWYVQQDWHGSRVEEILVGMVYGYDRENKQQVL